MNINRLFLILLFSSFTFFIPVILSASDSEINSSNHGLHLRFAPGAGAIFRGYLLQGNETGDIGSGQTGAINLAALYNYSLPGIEVNVFSENIGDLDSSPANSDVDGSGKSTGTGFYNIFDFKLGAKLFTEQDDMGYTFIYLGKRFWNSKRTAKTWKWDGVKRPACKYKAEGDGWIFGFRDFSTINISDNFDIVIQSGLFLGKAPVTKLSVNQIDLGVIVNKSYNTGGELAAGAAFKNIGLSIVGGIRAELNFTTFHNYSTWDDWDENESSFYAGNALFFIEAGMMF